MHKHFAWLLFLLVAPVGLCAAQNNIDQLLENAVQKQAPTAKDLCADEVLKNHANRIARVTLEADLPSRYWTVSCSALLTGRSSLRLDNPCTEALATAFTEQAPISIRVDMKNLGSFTKGAYKDQGFFYSGRAYPSNFKVLKNGYSLYQVPVQDKQARQALQTLAPLSMQEGEWVQLFQALPAPISRVSLPRSEVPLNYKAADIAPYKAFLSQLQKDIAAYVKTFRVTAEVKDCIGFLNAPFPAKGFIANRKGGVILADNGATDEGTAFQYVEDIKRSGANEEELCLYISMPGLGQYENGKAFYSAQPPLPAKVFWLTPAQAFGFTMKLPPQKPVAQKLNSPQTQKLFKEHTIADLWLTDYGPRIQRALDMLP